MTVILEVYPLNGSGAVDPALKHALADGHFARLASVEEIASGVLPEGTTIIAVPRETMMPAGFGSDDWRDKAEFFSVELVLRGSDSRELISEPAPEEQARQE